MLLWLLLFTFSFTLLAKAGKVVHLIPPTEGNEKSDDTWHNAVDSLEEGDTVVLGEKTYHLGKKLGGWGFGSTVFMDADSPAPTVVKFLKSPSISKDHPNLSLKIEFKTLKELERNHFPVAKALDLGPQGLAMRQALSPGVSLDEYFEKIFPNQMPEQKKKAVEAIDGLLHALAEHHLFTTDLRSPNVFIVPKTGQLTVIDPGDFIPNLNSAAIEYVEVQHLAQKSREARDMFRSLGAQAACAANVKSLQPGAPPPKAP